MKDQIAIPRRRIWVGKVRADPMRDLSTRGSDINHRNPGPRQSRAQIGNQKPHEPPAHDRDAVGGAGRAVPQRVERRFHIRSEHGTPRGHALGHGNHSVRQYGEKALVWMQAKNDARFGGAGLDLPYRRVAVFHRKRKGAGHQRRAHALVFACRYSAGKDEPFGAPTDRPEQRTDLDLASLGRVNRLLAQLGSAGRHIPERFALHLGSCFSFLR